MVTNSIKHTFDDGKEGSIIIQLHKMNDKLLLIVKDDGVGFPKTLGLQLINSLVIQLDGTLDLKSTVEQNLKLYSIRCNTAKRYN